MIETLKVKGIKIGSVEDKEALTGCTVIICEEGMTPGVDVRGGAPGTRETDLMNPLNSVDKIHALLLSGGSAFGLNASSGVVKYLEERGIGFDVGVAKVPIVSSAVIFDLAIGSANIRPDEKMGYEACLKAENTFKSGSYGAGCGASIGKIRGHEYALKSGQGIYTIEMQDGLIVTAIVVLNAFGDVYEDGKLLGGALNDDKTGFLDTEKYIQETGQFFGFAGGNTTIGAILTNANLNKSQTNKIAQMAHNGYARAIRPVHTSVDGDTIFCLATNKVEIKSVDVVGTLSVIAMEKAILNALKTSKSMKDIKSLQEIIK